MSYQVLTATVAAGNATDATIYEVPAGYSAAVGNIIGFNTTGGSLNLTIKLKRDGTTYILTPVVSVTTVASSYYGRNATNSVCPLTLKAGDVLLAQASGAGVQITVSGLLFS